MEKIDHAMRDDLNFLDWHHKEDSKGLNRLSATIPGSDLGRFTEAERNIEISDTFFAFKQIAGYEYKNTRETATKAIMPYVSSFYSNNVGLTLYTSFKLGNGSVILCLKCENNNTEKINVIYDQAIFGGDIPLNVGNVLMVNPGEKHQFKNSSDSKSASLVCLIPVGYQK